MKEMIGNLWDQTDFNAICITTNGFVKKNGEAVMGRGCAKEAKDKWPEVPKTLGLNIKLTDNDVNIILDDIGKCSIDGSKINLVSFPVKPKAIIFDGNNVVKHLSRHYRIGDIVPGWAAKAELDIIKRSAKQLVEMTDRKEWKKVLLVRPGCGAGELKWEEVKPILESILDDRFYIITKEMGE